MGRGRSEAAGLFIMIPPLNGGGFTFLSFGFAKREESNKGEKSESRGISIFPLDNPLLKTTTQGAAAPYVENPRGLFYRQRVRRGTGTEIFRWRKIS